MYFVLTCSFPVFSGNSFSSTCSSDDLPAPTGPTIATNVPCLISKLMSQSVSTIAFSIHDAFALVIFIVPRLSASSICWTAASEACFSP